MLIWRCAGRQHLTQLLRIQLRHAATGPPGSTRQLGARHVAAEWGTRASYAWKMLQVPPRALWTVSCNVHAGCGVDCSAALSTRG